MHFVRSVGSYLAGTSLVVAGMGFATLGGTAAATGLHPKKQSMSVELIVGVNGSPFYEAMACGAKAEAAALHVTLKVAAPSEFAPAQQLPLVDAAISAHPSAIALVPTDPKALDAAAQQAIHAGIKLLTADQVLSQTTGVSTQILSNNIAGGAQIANEMAREIHDKGQVLVLTTEPGQVTSQDQRAQGFLKQLKNYRNIKYIGSQYSNDEPSLTASQVTEELSRYPHLAAIFATNDQSGIGAATGLASAHLTGKVKLFAYDAAVSQVQSLRQGAVQGLIAQEPRVEGVDAVKYGVLAAEGRPVPKIIETATKLLTRATPLSVLHQYEYQGNC